jgi:hypothetical protein
MTADRQPPLVEMRDMRVSFGGVHAVADVNIDLRARRGGRPRRRQRRRQVHPDAGRSPARIRPIRARSSSTASRSSITNPRDAKAYGHRDDLPDAGPRRQRRRGGQHVPRPRADDAARARSTTRRWRRDAQGDGPAQPQLQELQDAGEVAVGRPAPVGRHRPRGPLQRPDPDHGRADRGAWARPRPPRSATWSSS